MTQPPSFETAAETPGRRPTRSPAALLGRNEQMREVRNLIDRVADTDVTVLIAEAYQ